MPLVDAISARNRLEDAAREAVARKTEGLRLYRPRPEMVPFHSSAAMERVVKGGNRCSAEGTVVWKLTPPNKDDSETTAPTPVPIESLQRGDWIVGFSGQLAAPVPALVLHTTAFTECGYRLTTARAYSTAGTHDHPVLCNPPESDSPQWRDVTDIPTDWRVRIADPQREPEAPSFWDRVVSVAPAKETRFIGIRTHTGTYLSDGIYSHNSGKTTAAVAEVAAACLHQPITTLEGEVLPLRYPKPPMMVWGVGYDEKHIARMYRKLCEPGLYKIIQDKATGQWRSWRPWEPDDAARKKETRRSAPLIPARAIETIAWVNKAEQVPSVITLKNGTRIFFFTSGGEAGVGEAIDLIWIDEDIKFESHVQEWQARLADNEGRLIWSSWPKGSNMALRLMVKRAEEQANRPDPDVQCWTMKFSANPYIPEASKQKILAAWSSSGQEALLARDLGEFADGLQLVFPTFDIEKHGIPLKGDPDPVQRAVMDAIDHIPEGWTYYLTLDPGFAHIAATFGMVPPPTLGDVIVIRRSWYWARVDHYTVARDIKEEFPDVPWHAFIIDSHAGRIHTTGRGERVMDLFSEAFLSEGLEGAITGCGFIGGSDDVAARNMIVRKMLNSNTKHGKPRFRLWSEDTYSMQQEFFAYKCRIGKTDTEDILARDNHSMDCNGYLAAYLNPLFAVGEAWQAPPRAPVKDPLAKILQKLEGRPQRSQGSPSFYLGAGTAPTGATV